jgi:flap endonuclease-1
MGIKGFTKAFEHQGEIKLKDLKGKVIAVDAMYQLYRTAHPFNTTAQSILTAPDGTSTNHINGLIALIFNLKNAGIQQYWIFDNPAENHNGLKAIEQERRRSCKAAAKQKLAVLDQNPLAEEKLFSDEDDNVDDIKKLETTASAKLQAAIERNKYVRASFSLDIYMIEDLKYMLLCFGVPWIEAPAGYEAEQVAAYLTHSQIDGRHVDYVLTTDIDTLLFGARKMLKQDKQKYYKYELADIHEQYQISQKQLITAGVMLGCDFAKKTPGAGPKTVLKKLNAGTRLTDEQLTAIDYFTKPICAQVLSTLKWNAEEVPFMNAAKIRELIEWITEVKGFNHARILSRFKTAKIKMS